MMIGNKSRTWSDLFVARCLRKFLMHLNVLLPTKRRAEFSCSRKFSDTHRKPPGVARQQVTFLVLPRKVTQRRRPRFAAASRYPALLDWSGGCGTRAARSDITSDLAGGR